MTPTSQITVTNEIMIMRFPIGNTQIIKGMIDRLDTQTPFLPIYKAHVKIFIQYATTETLVRETTMQKLKQAAANKKKRSKKTIKMTVVCPET
jgi:hypothetical protein